MSVKIASQTTLSVAANSKSTDQISGTYQFIPEDGEMILYTKSSATGMNVTVTVNGIQVVIDQPIEYFGSTGTLAKKDNETASIPVNNGSRVELFFRNTTGGALTVDFSMELEV
jgi:hypothetical protein